MAEVRRISPEDARRKVTSGKALFVCAYDSEEMCGRMRLEGSTTMGELQSRLRDVGKDQEIIFYCK